MLPTGVRASRPAPGRSGPFGIAQRARCTALRRDARDHGASDGPLAAALQNYRVHHRLEQRGTAQCQDAVDLVGPAAHDRQRTQSQHSEQVVAGSGALGQGLWSFHSRSPMRRGNPRQAACQWEWRHRSPPPPPAAFTPAQRVPARSGRRHNARDLLVRIAAYADTPKWDPPDRRMVSECPRDWRRAGASQCRCFAMSRVRPARRRHLSGAVAQHPDAIVVALRARSLAIDDRTDIRGQVRLQGFPIPGNGRIFTALALFEH